MEKIKGSLAAAVFAALAASSIGVSARDTVPNMAGSRYLKAITDDVLVECGANCAGITYVGRGDRFASVSLGSGLQNVAPSYGRFQHKYPEDIEGGPDNFCAGSDMLRSTKGIVFALDSVSVLGNSSTACNANAQGLHFDPAIANSWRDVLRLLYTGMPPGTSTDVTIRECNSAARRALINNWDDLFRGSCVNCADSNPDSAVTEPGLRHAFRRGENSAATEVFLGALSLSAPNFTHPGAPAFYPGSSQQAFRSLANSPFCNVKRPNDTYLAVTVPPNATPAQIHAGTAKVIPPAFYIGDAPTGASGFDHDSNPATPPQLRSLIIDPLTDDYGDDVSYPEMQDQDPVRRKCVSDNFDTYINQTKPTEQVCGADGQLGVVLPIDPPPPTANIPSVYPNVICDAGAYEFGPGVLNSFGGGIRCPNGDEPLGAPAQCRLPIAPSGKYNCFNGGGFWIASGNGVAFAANGAPAVVDGDIVGETQGRTDIDGRVYNLVLRDALGNPAQVSRPATYSHSNINTPLIGAFYRIHSTRSLLPSAGTKTCVRSDPTEQLGCLVQASPCSLAYANGDPVSTNPGGTIALRVNNVLPDVTSVQNLVTGNGSVYPFARKLYLNTLRGFANPIAPFTGSDGETDLVRSFVTETVSGSGSQFGGSLPASFGLIPLPASGPFCEDFNENGACFLDYCAVSGSRYTCGQVNSNACASALGVAGIPDSTVYCGNGVMELGEGCDDGNAITDSRTPAQGDPTDDRCSVGCSQTP